MSGTFGTNVRNKILDHVFGVTTYTPPATLYFGLTNTNPGADGNSGTGEPSGNGYARVSKTNDTALWNNASSGAKDNKIAVTFPTATGAGWGSLGYFTVWIHATNTGSTDYVGGGSLAASKTIDAGDTAEFAIGDFDITLS